MKNKILASLLALGISTCSLNAVVGLVDVEVGAGIWSPNLDGNVRYDGVTKGTDVDFKDDLDLEADSGAYAYVRVDHFLPFVPNVRVEMQNYSASGDKIKTVKFGDTTLSGTVSTDITLDQKDFILYWGIPGVNALSAGVLDIELGLDYKKFDGEIKLEDSSGNSNSVDIDSGIPLGYGAVLVDLPMLPLRFEASIKTLGKVFNETKAKADFTFLNLAVIKAALEVGYKKQVLDIDDDVVDDLTLKIDNSGLFYGVNVRF